MEISTKSSHIFHHSASFNQIKIKTIKTFKKCNPQWKSKKKVINVTLKWKSHPHTVKFLLKSTLPKRGCRDYHKSDVNPNPPNRGKEKFIRFAFALEMVYQNAQSQKVSYGVLTILSFYILCFTFRCIAWCHASPSYLNKPWNIYY